MTAPTYVARGSLVAHVGSTILVPYYAGLAANDIAIIQVGLADTATIAAPSGWSSVGTFLDSSRRISFFWKRLAGSESGTVSVTVGDSSCGVMFGASGCITSGTPFEGFNSAADTSGIGPSITVTGIERLAVWGFFLHDTGQGLSGGSFGSPAAGWTERLDSNDADSNYMATDTQTTSSNVSANSRGSSTGDIIVSGGFALLPVASTPVPVFMNHYRNNGMA
jgi:hypothetical protein